MSYATIINPAGSAVPTFTRDTEWVRNPFWEPIAHPSDERARALYQVDNGTNKLALTVTGGNFTVDWGDGSAPEDFTAGALAEHEYLYSDTDLVGTEAPCTVASDVITHNNHGLSNGDPQSVYAVGGGSVVLAGYVVNATANTFQISLTLGGDPATIADGSYQLLSYRQAVVEIYPQAGHFIGVLDFNAEPTGITSGHNNKILELKAHIPNCAGVPKLGSWSAIYGRCLSLQNLVLTGTGHLDGPADTELFALISLVRAEVETTNWTRLCNPGGSRGGFESCFSLRHVIMDTGNVVNFSRSFNTCSSLRAIQLNTSSGTNFSATFASCSSLESVDINTSNGVTFTSMFNGCAALTGDLTFDVGSATNLTDAFKATGIENLTLLNVGTGVIAHGMCEFCTSLVTFTGDLSGCSDLSSTFQGCTSLQSLSSYNFSSATSLYQTFNNCYGMTGHLVLVSPLVSTINQAFRNTNFDSITMDAESIASVSTSDGDHPWTNTSTLPRLILADLAVNFQTYSNRMQLSRLQLVEFFENVADVTSLGGRTLNFVGQPGAASLTAPDLAIATSKGWTVVT